MTKPSTDPALFITTPTPPTGVPMLAAPEQDAVDLQPLVDRSCDQIIYPFSTVPDQIGAIEIDEETADFAIPGFPRDGDSIETANGTTHVYRNADRSLDIRDARGKRCAVVVPEDENRALQRIIARGLGANPLARQIETARAKRAAARREIATIWVLHLVTWLSGLGIGYVLARWLA